MTLLAILEALVGANAIWETTVRWDQTINPQIILDSNHFGQKTSQPRAIRPQAIWPQAIRPQIISSSNSVKFWKTGQNFGLKSRLIFWAEIIRLEMRFRPPDALPESKT